MLRVHPTPTILDLLGVATKHRHIFIGPIWFWYAARFKNLLELKTWAQRLKVHTKHQAIKIRTNLQLNNLKRNWIALSTKRKSCKSLWKEKTDYLQRKKKITVIADFFFAILDGRRQWVTNLQSDSGETVNLEFWGLNCYSGIKQTFSDTQS